MKKLRKAEERIFFSMEDIFKNKSRRLHDPLFIGNEKKYLSDCITSGYVSYVGKYVNIFEKKLSLYTKSKHSVATSSGTAAINVCVFGFGFLLSSNLIMPGIKIPLWLYLI